MVSGYLAVGVANEQDAVSRIVAFLRQEIGWTIAQDVTDTGTDRDVVLRSIGEPDSGNGLPRYIRLRGFGNNIFLSTYKTFISTSNNTGELKEDDFGKINVGTDGFRLIVVADLERAVIHCDLNSGTRVQGYVGRIKTYEKAQHHPYPNIVKGGDSFTYDWYYNLFERNAFMYAPDDTIQHYYAIELIGSTALDASGLSTRTGDFIVSAPVIVHSATSQNREAVGEPRGVYRVPTEVADHNNFITINDDIYVVLESNSKSWAVGPITTVSGVDVVRAETDLVTV